MPSTTKLTLNRCRCESCHGDSPASYRIRAAVGVTVVAGTPIDIEPTIGAPMTGAAIVVIGTDAPNVVAGRAAEIEPTIGAPITGDAIVVIGTAAPNVVA